MIPTAREDPMHRPEERDPMDDEETSMTFTSDRDLHDLQGGAVSSLTGRWGPRRAGPSPYLRLDFTVKARQGYEAYMLVLGQGLSFRHAADLLGLSGITTWRRYHFFSDLMLPVWHGGKPGPIPPQRGTRACPRGRPYLPTLDGPGAPLHRPQGGIPK